MFCRDLTAIHALNNSDFLLRYAIQFVDNACSVFREDSNELMNLIRIQTGPY